MSLLDVEDGRVDARLVHLEYVAPNLFCKRRVFFFARAVGELPGLAFEAGNDGGFRVDAVLGGVKAGDGFPGIGSRSSGWGAHGGRVGDRRAISKGCVAHGAGVRFSFFGLAGRDNSRMGMLLSAPPERLTAVGGSIFAP